MSDATTPSAAGAPDLALAPDMPRTGRDLGTLSAAERTSERARLMSSPAYAAGDPHAVELVREHIAFDLAQREAAERQPARADASRLHFNEMEMAAFVPQAEIEATIAGARAIFGKMSEPPSQAVLDEAMKEGRRQAKMDEADRARDLEENANYLRGAWRESFDQNRGRVSRFLDHYGARELAEATGIARSASGMVMLLTLAERNGF